MYILGISAFFHDSSASILFNGEIIAAAQEERFSRRKNDHRFPFEAVKYCLEEAGITLNQVDHIVFYEKPFVKFERLLETYLAFAPKGLISFWKSMPLWIKEKLHQRKNIILELQKLDSGWDSKNQSILFSNHHLSHAASAFYPSPFTQSMILTLDGVGEWATTSICKGEGNNIETLKEILFPHSIGLLYSAFTYYLGFKVNCDEYKVMGLAPYGKPKYKELIYKHLIDVKSDGSFKLNMSFFTFATELRMVGKKFEKLFGQNVREKKEELTNFHVDMAASVQKVTEEVILHIVNNIHKEFGGDNLCLAGGVALNCVANGRVLRESSFKNIWIQPAASDAGGSLGAALAVHYGLFDNERVVNECDSMKNGLLGPAFTNNQIESLLVKSDLEYIFLSDDHLFNAVATQITQGKVVGFFRGRMEFGPRALGARSIIGDPRNITMQSTMNLKIKYRESFRPFAPIVMEEYCSEYFDIDTPSPYMLLVAQVNSSKLKNLDSDEAFGIEKLHQIRSVIPAVTHVDNSARVQTVSKQTNEPLYKLLHAFYEQTGCPVLINTSFNVMNEPIVCTPSDAIRCFLACEMDVLVLENYVVKKRG